MWEKKNECNTQIMIDKHSDPFGQLGNDLGQRLHYLGQLTAPTISVFLQTARSEIAFRAGRFEKQQKLLRQDRQKKKKRFNARGSRLDCIRI